MDEATKRLRKKIKADLQAASKKKLVHSYKPEAFGLGRRNKRNTTFPAQTCNYRVDAEKFPIKRQRKDGTYYNVMVIVGGTKCQEAATTSTKRTGPRCLDHISATY